MDRTSSSRERHAVEATFSYAPVRPFLPRHPPPSAPLLFPPRLASPLPTLAPASFCGCAQSWPIENSSLLNGAAIGPKSLELPGRGGDYSRSSLFLGCVDGRRTEALCDVAGSAEGKVVMAAATLAEKVSATGSTQALLWGWVSGGGLRGQPGQEVEEMLGCWVRKAQTLCGRGRQWGPGPAWPIGTGEESAWIVPEVLDTASSRSFLPQVLVENAEEERSLAAAEELTSQKREQRLRKFRELHLKRVRTPGGYLRPVTWLGLCAFVEGRGSLTSAPERPAEMGERSNLEVLNPGSTLESLRK